MRLMRALVVHLIASSVLGLAVPGLAHAQAPTPSFTFTVPDTVLPDAPAAAPSHASGGQSGEAAAMANGAGDWTFNVYPILVWVPLNTSIEVEGPFDLSGGGGGNGGGGTGDVGGKLVDTRFDGAFLAGFSATNGTWRFHFDGVYAAVGGDRVAPNLTVDVNLIYAHASVGREIAGGFFVTGGVRRFALKSEIDFLDFDTFTNKPGIWDPLVGLGYHTRGEKFEFHAHAEYGGFGVGADTDVGLGALVDWKPFDHFGFTAGYSLVSFKFKKEVGPYEFSAKQTVAGPVVGIGLYF